MIQKRRRKFKIFFLLIILLEIFIGIEASKCDRIPEGSGAKKSPADGRFRIRVSGNQDFYTPGEVYTISLSGSRVMQHVYKFSSFMLIAENSASNGFPYGTAGEFQLMGDTLTKFSDKCPNVVTQTTVVPKTEIQVQWTAPPPGSGCVVFKATVIEHRDVWYMDDGPLNKKLCEDEQGNLDNQPIIVESCGACNEAKYEMAFEGLWSRHQHPQNYPENSWLTRFSDIIGASHTADYSFWEYGRNASEGLRLLAEHGSTNTLESELKSQSENIRTIIKARGITYPNVTGRTFAVFRVDPNHHLVSFVSEIHPSPDWFVGVSKLELCLSNGSWIDQKVLNLYPVDAGTDSGPSYESPDQPTNPPDVVRRIKSTFPNDPRSPFYDPSGADMKPMARIYFIRQRVYGKDCENQSEEEERGGSRACETTSWGSFGPCSSQCGRGERRRRRNYLNPALANQNRCNKRLVDVESCEGRESYCSDNEPEEDGSNELIPYCQLTNWSEWSECSKLCGRGRTTRTRHYVHPNAREKCQRATQSPSLEQWEDCWGNICGGDIQDSNTKKVDDDTEDCRLSDWSEWSECNATCGQGVKMRFRYPIIPYFDPDEVKQKAYDQFKRASTNDDGEEDDDYRPNLLDFDESHPCFDLTLWDTEVCDQPVCAETPLFCNEKPEIGYCRGQAQNISNRWYYDPNRHDCAIFAYSGCRGKENNFMSRNDCIMTCKPVAELEGSINMSRLPIRDQRRPEMNYRHNTGRRVDCRMSNWERGSCNVTCGHGYRLKSRRILTHPQFGGHPCPTKLTRHERCHVPCDPQHDTNPSWGPTRVERQEFADCEYTPWSSWSPCSRTCGDYSVQQRTRYVLNSNRAVNCPHRVETRQCNVMPCSI